MLSKSFDKFFINMLIIYGATWAYHWYVGTPWTWMDHWKDPVSGGDLIWMTIFVVGAIYKSADAIVAAITRRQGVEAVANALT